MPAIWVIAGIGGFMPLPTLEKLKQQCRLDEDNTFEDELLKTYLMAAKQRAEGYINRHLYEGNIPEEDPDGLLITDDIISMKIEKQPYYQRDLNYCSTPIVILICEE